MQVLNLTLLLAVAGTASSGDSRVLNQPVGHVPPDRLVEADLKRQCWAAIERRRAAYERLKTRDDCIGYQQRMREFFRQQIGGFPERTPLEARVVGRLEGDGFRVEKIIYASQPRHHVTALLYLPRTKPPYPGVLIPCGHSHNGKAAEGYQRIGMLLARNGMAALCYDPIGQGERYQVLAHHPQKHFFGFPRLSLKPPHPLAKYLCTTEHTLTDVGAILVGANAARYRIWDGMRGIDYLVSRPDIDPTRIGCTGNSGGGTLTSYIMALDKRVACAAPACYLTTFQRLLDAAGPQDGEQNIFGQIAFGMDEAEYVLMRAPKPTIILAGTRDRTFDIRGTWEVFRDAKRFYARFGYPERVALVEADAPHGFTVQLREASVRWMRRWLIGKDEPVFEGKLKTFSDEQVQCTPEGQVMLLPGERSVFDLNAELERRLAEQRRRFWQTATSDQARQRIRELIAARPLAKLPAPIVERVGRIERNGYSIDKLTLTPPGGVPLPALAFVPPKPKADTYLYVHGEGKQADAARDGPIERLVRNGFIVLAIDVRGCGELRRSDNPRIRWTAGLFGPCYHEFMLAYLLGQSFVGLRVEDILTAARFLSKYQPNTLGPASHQTGIGPRTGRRPVHLIGVGETAIPALHAAALEPDLFASLLLRRTIRSWREVVQARETENQLINVVHGALAVYDLPDLQRLYGTNRIQIETDRAP
ncbi:MAG: prolyl oligopeptidase family serine peptidase [Planctomycetes bacterium]|nr:prolyl oligopeptidase family serine peptidase [Planctomycetota bacterium]